MVPVADMLNHKTGSNNARLFTDEDDDDDDDDDSEEDGKPEKEKKDPKPFEMRTICEVDAGTDLYNTYGELCNGELLRKYGFVEELSDKNPHNYVELPLKLVLEVCKKNVPVYEERLKFLKEKEMIDPTGDDTYPIESGMMEIPQDLDIVLRMFHMNKEEWAQWVSDFEKTDDMQCDLDDCDHADHADHAEKSDVDILEKISEKFRKKGIEKTEKKTGERKKGKK